jgi:fatty acid desaturase
MAIADVAEYTHLSAADVEALAVELDGIRLDIEDSRGENDRAYIQRTIAVQRCLDVAARVVIGASRTKTGWVLGTLALAAAKSIENMELGHNIGHGQWDWMNDPEIHSTTWEWDMVGLSSQWRYSHNYRHHVFTNVVGVDDDLGYGVLRVTRDQQWKPSNLLQPLRHLLLAVTFEWGIALHDLHSEQERGGTDAEKSAHTRALLRKIGRQAGKDWCGLPLVSRQQQQSSNRAAVFSEADIRGYL